MIPKSVCMAALLAFAALSSAAQDAGTEEDGGPMSIVFVLDSSGSMWGKIGETFKRDIAMEALSNIAGEMPEDAHVGLVAYGHRRKSDCDDIETLLPIEQGGASKIAAAASNIRSLGKTPLSASVTRAATMLASRRGNNAVILITDGIETCGVDPCSLADDLDQTGVRVKTHIVGFGLSDEEGQQIACLAEDTGGLYIQAADAAELNDALGQAVNNVSNAEAPAAPIGEPTLLRAVGGDGALLTGDPVRWSISSQPGTGTSISEAAIGFEKRVILPAGDYTLVASHGELELEQAFTVEAGADNIVEVSFVDGTIVLVPVLAELSQPLRGVYNWKMFRILPSGKRVDAASEPEDTVTFTLPPGRYEAVFTSGAFEKTHTVEVIAGQTTNQNFVLDAGKLNLAAENHSGVGEFRILDARGNLVVREVTTRRSWFLLAPGTYTVVATFGGTEMRSTAAVTAGEESSLTVTFP